MHSHNHFMQRCLDLARNGKGTVSPNPLVGSVVVHQNAIIGEGWHYKSGFPHAEVNAINSVKDQSLLKESAIYVNLEPCSHHGKTPPCASIIIEKQIPKVFVASLDPNPAVAGNGIKRLKDAGIEVEVGIMKVEADELNRKFMTYHKFKRPYVTLKWAETHDGFMDKTRTQNEKGSFKISGPEAKVYVHKLRSEHDAILIGSGTAAVDNPSLTTREFQGKNPIRIVLDRNDGLPENLELFTDDYETWKFVISGNNQHGNKKTIKLDNQDFLQEMLKYCYGHGIQSILVEGGRAIHQAFLENGSWDEILVLKSNESIGKGLPSPRLDFGPTSADVLGNDRLTKYRNNAVFTG